MRQALISPDGRSVCSRLMPSLTEHAEALRALQRPGDPLVLANVWDAATARVVAGASAPALATSSAAVAESRGYADRDIMPADIAFDAVATVTRAVPELPVTADLEAGYRLPSDDLVGRLLAAGAVGCNIEDTDHHGDGMLIDAAVQAERLGSIRRAADRAAVPIVLNARVDVFRSAGATPLDELLPAALDRCRRYLDAGADTVYPIGLTDESAISTLVAATEGMVNIWVRPDGLPLRRLRELGVARVSLATGLFRAALHTVRDEAARIYGGA
jgi:2-methylisocitrate lyase-like PEP mutase family enzyme